jgi:hypothetical protein
MANAVSPIFPMTVPIFPTTFPNFSEAVPNFPATFPNFPRPNPIAKSLIPQLFIRYRQRHPEVAPKKWTYAMSRTVPSLPDAQWLCR